MLLPTLRFLQIWAKLLAVSDTRVCVPDVPTFQKLVQHRAKIRMNSHELHSEMGRWAVPKTPWVERICHLCENKKIEDENHFLLECPVYTHIKSQFHNLCCNPDLPSLLTCQDYIELETLLSKLFEHRNTIKTK